MTALRFQTGGDIRIARPPFRPQERRRLREEFESSKYRLKDQKARNQTTGNKQTKQKLPLRPKKKKCWFRVT